MEKILADSHLMKAGAWRAAQRHSRDRSGRCFSRNPRLARAFHSRSAFVILAESLFFCRRVEIRAWPGRTGKGYGARAGSGW